MLRTGLWQETAFVRATRGRSHLDEVHVPPPVPTPVREKHGSARHSALTPPHAPLVSATRKQGSTPHKAFAIRKTSEIMKMMRKALPGQRWSLRALSAQRESREARGRCCCVPRQHGQALSQGDKGLLANVHIPIHVMNTS